MPYSESVTFSETGRYGVVHDNEDDVYTVEEFLHCCQTGAFIDYDGFGNPVKDNLANPSIHIIPSRCGEIPADATHVVWYNR